MLNTPADDTYKRGIQYVWVLLPKACSTFRVGMVEAEGDIVQLYKKHAADAAVVASGGFRLRSQAQQAEGVHISQGVLLRPRAKWNDKGKLLGGFLVQAANRVRVLPATTADAALAPFAEVLQTMPVLLKASQVDGLREDFVRSNRVAVLVGGNGQIGVLGAFGL